MDPTYPLVPIANLLSVVLMLLSLFSLSLRFRSVGQVNVGVLVLGIWLLIDVLWVGVDTIVWAKHARPIIPVWCKICG